MRLHIALALTTIVSLASVNLLFNRNGLGPATNEARSGEVTENTTKEEETINTENTENTKIVIFAGPMKTGSTSIQYNFHRWMTQEKWKSFNDWVWASPPAIEKAMKEGYHQYKALPYAFVRSLKGKGYKNATFCWSDELRRVYSNYTCNDIRENFEEEFKSIWKRNKNLLIASEAFYNVGTMSPTDSAALVKNLKSVMPWAVPSVTSGQELSMEDITVVVNYRAPRVTHLISFWHQCCDKRMSFADYLVSDALGGGLAQVDSLQMVERFLDYGFRVVLIDLLGVSNHGFDTANVIACSVMQVPCNSLEQTILGSTDEPKRVNVKEGRAEMGNITEDQLQVIDSVILRRDCTFAHLQNHSRLEIIHGDAVLANWAGCTQDQQDDREYDRQAMEEELRKMLNKTTSHSGGAIGGQ